MELNFKQHIDGQLTAYTKLLEQYISTINLCFGQLHQQVHKLSKGKSAYASAYASEPNQEPIGDGGFEL